jgi:uncharacterized PurR-regulated membrane protein YhhQ (DUF165 family)
MSNADIIKQNSMECSDGPMLKYFIGIAVIFIASCLVPHGANALIIPVLQYVSNMVLVEVYGYVRTRRVLWMGFMISALALGLSLFMRIMFPKSNWPDLGFPELKSSIISRPTLLIFGNTVFFIYWIVAFVSSYVFAKMKVLMNGRHLWARIAVSLLVGKVIVDTFLSALLLLSFGAVASVSEDISWRIIHNHFSWALAFTVICSVLSIPLIYAVAGWLKCYGSIRRDR